MAGPDWSGRLAAVCFSTSVQSSFRLIQAGELFFSFFAAFFSFGVLLGVFFDSFFAPLSFDIPETPSVR
jgi:hypothetical protein